MFSNFLTNKFYTLSWLLYDSSKHRYFHLHRSEYEIFLFSDCEAWRGCYTKRTDKSKQTMLLIALECCFTFFKRLYVKSGKKFFVFVINFYPMNENVNCHSSSGVFREENFSAAQVVNIFSEVVKPDVHRFFSHSSFSLVQVRCGRPGFKVWGTKDILRGKYFCF